MKFAKIIFLIITFSPIYSFAGWNAGGGIEWKTIGKDSLQIFITVYRDCNESKTTKGTLNIAASCHSKTITSFDTLVYQQNATSNCPSQCTPCQGGTCTFKYGFQKTVFSTIIGLDSFRKCSNCTLVIKYISSSTRIFSITTGARNTALSYLAELSLCDTTSFHFSFADDPLFVNGLGANNRTTSHRLITSGVDSVVYSYTSPMYANGVKIPYTGSYSFEKPLYYLGFPKTNLRFPRGFGIDPNTGTLLFTPMMVEVSTFAVEAKIYKNGQYYGSTMREQAIFIEKAEDLSLPKSGGWNCHYTSPTFETETCEGAKMIRTLCAFDDDKFDSITIEVLDSVKGAIITRTDVKTKHQKLVFEWTPDSTQVGTHHIRIRINDNSCPIQHSIDQVLTINVLQKPQHTWITSKYLGCGKVFYTLRNSDRATLYKINWKTDLGGKTLSTTSTKDTFVVDYKSGGDKKISVNYYTGKYQYPKCRDTLTYTSNITDTFLQLTKSNDTAVCAGSEIDIKANLKNYTGKTAINWSTGNKTNSSSSQIKGVIINNDSIFTIEYSDDYCQLSQDIIVMANQPNRVTINYNNYFCINDSLLLMRTPLVKDTTDSIVTINWLDSTGYIAKNIDSFSFSSGGNYYVETIDSLGCVFRDSFNITRINPRLILPSDTFLCSGIEYKLPLYSKPIGIVDYYVLKGKDTLSQRNNWNLLTIKPDTQLMVYLRLSLAIGQSDCVVHDSLKIDIYPDSNQMLQGPKTACLNQEIMLNTKGFYNTRWYFNDTSILADSLIYKRTNNKHEGDTFFMKVKGFYGNSCCTEYRYPIYHSKPINPDFKLKDTIKNPAYFKPINLSNTVNNAAFTWSLMADSTIVFKGFEPTIYYGDNRVFDLKLSAIDSFGCESDTIKRIHLDKYVSLNQQANNELLIYPNPVRQQLTIEDENGIDELYLFDLKGSQIHFDQPKSTIHTINMQRLPKGLYLLKTSNKLGVAFIKIEKI